MSRVAEFSSYVGLIVLISALILVSPRATVAVWGALLAWLRGRGQDLHAWRPRTVRQERRSLPVEVHVGPNDVHRSPHGELLEPPAPEGVGYAVRELWRIARELLEAGALVLAVTGILLRLAGTLVNQLPPVAVFLGDVGVVVATFLVMRRVIRCFPAELLPSVRFPRSSRPVRVTAPPMAPPRSGRLDHAVQLVALTVVLLELLTWPSQLAGYLTGARLSGAGDQLAVGWAAELLWVVAIAWVLTWDSRPRIVSVTADVVHLLRPISRPISRPAAPAEQRAA